MPRDYTLKPGHTASRHIDYAAELNEQQLAAVSSPPGQALVIAGAGSGKTRTLTYRVAYLLDNGILPDNILLLTFTNKAAREMVERVAALLPMETSGLWGGTFHSICARILRRNAAAIGFTPGFTILDAEDQRDVIASAIAECDIDIKLMRFPKPNVCADMFSFAENTGQPLRSVVAAKYPYFEELLPQLAQVRERYAEKKAEANSMDFDDLLIQTIRLFKENAGIREGYQHQFQFILVDEYQDTNHVQNELIETFAGRHGNIMVVGDDAQSIYSWRGANFQNILEFPKRYPKAQVFKIETNYRSTPEVLTLANAAIAANTRQFEKTLRPSRDLRDFRPALVPLSDARMQASFVAQRILELRDEGIELDEIAVLYRAHFHSMEVQMELTNRGIPFAITSGLRFFEQAHIKDLAAFMKFATNRRDEVAFKRMVHMLPGVGGKSAQKLWLGWLKGAGAKTDLPPDSFSEHLLSLPAPKKSAAAWQQLCYTLDELVEPGGKFAAPADMITSVLEGVYDDYMRTKFPNYEQRREDINTLRRFSESFPNAVEFLAQLALLAGVDGQPEQNAARDSEAVTLSSIHQAKGLEWKAVFVIWLAEGMFPNNRALEEGSAEAVEEERRLFYVAVTRAMDELYLTYPQLHYSSYQGETLQQPSRFLEELPKDTMEEWRVGRGW
ncbi:MAG: ATP-dependent helicase [Verrucomicrobiales bacterium]